jgi:hypothetical protein
LPCVQIRKSDDLRNDCAKNRALQILLAQSLAMQIISTHELSRASAHRLQHLDGPTR